MTTRCRVSNMRSLARFIPLIASLGLLLPVLAGAHDNLHQRVSVLYAGSLATVMERLGPVFVAATGYEYQGEAQGSLGAARMIRDHLRQPDVFISADPSVNVNVLMGAANRNLVKWYTLLASSQLVLGFSPASRFADRFRDAQAGTVPWYEVLKTPGVRFGRGDPTIDPKGYRTLFLFRLAAEYYHRPDLYSLLGDPINAAQVFPEVVLMGQLQSGQCDAGIFYKHEAVAHKLPYISLPSEINLGDARFENNYARQIYTTAKGERIAGSRILLTITIPETVHDRQAALSFVRFMLSSDQFLRQFGLGTVEHQVGGDCTKVPVELRSLAAAGTFQP